MSAFANLNGLFSVWLFAMVLTIRRKTWPSCAIDCCGAWIFVLLLTDGIVVLLTFRSKERSRMHLNFRDLWGMTAKGEILMCWGRSFLMSPYVTIEACLLCSFSIASAMMYCRACGFFADVCGP